jgi:hypothetical protein
MGCRLAILVVYHSHKSAGRYPLPYPDPVARRTTGISAHSEVQYSCSAALVSNREYTREASFVSGMRRIYLNTKQASKPLAAVVTVSVCVLFWFSVTGFVAVDGGMNVSDSPALNKSPSLVATRTVPHLAVATMSNLPACPWVTSSVVGKLLIAPW